MNTLITFWYSVIIITWVIGLFAKSENQGLWWALPAGAGVGYAGFELVRMSGALG